METAKQVPTFTQRTQPVPSAVFDNGRRGNPRPGCDCVQCFGYCLVDRDEAARKSFSVNTRLVAE